MNNLGDIQAAADLLIAEFQGDAHDLEHLVGGMVLAAHLMGMSPADRSSFFKRLVPRNRSRKAAQ